MKKQILWAAGALALVAVPAVIGLWGNPSFAQSVPVRVPASGQVMTPTPTPTPSFDDRGGDTPRDQRSEPGDDRDVPGGVTQNPAPSPSADDNGGDRPRDERVEPGDDRRSGSDDSGGHGSGEDDRGDDHGGSGHGGDD